MVTVSPSHASIADAWIVGTGALLTLIVIAVDVAEQPLASVCVTVIFPDVLTEIEGDVAPVDHTFPFA